MAKAAICLGAFAVGPMAGGAMSGGDTEHYVIYQDCYASRERVYNEAGNFVGFHRVRVRD